MSVFAMSVPSRLSGLSGCVRSKNVLAGHGKLIDNGKLGAFVRLVRLTYNSLTYARACACIWGLSQISLGSCYFSGQAGQVKISNRNRF
jgi:hypothetical protein